MCCQMLSTCPQQPWWPIHLARTRRACAHQARRPIEQVPSPIPVQSSSLNAKLATGATCRARSQTKNQARELVKILTGSDQQEYSGLAILESWQVISSVTELQANGQWKRSIRAVLTSRQATLWAFWTNWTNIISIYSSKTQVSFHNVPTSGVHLTVVALRVVQWLAQDQVWGFRQGRLLAEMADLQDHKARNERYESHFFFESFFSKELFFFKKTNWKPSSRLNCHGDGFELQVHLGKVLLRAEKKHWAKLQDSWSNKAEEKEFGG